METNMCGWLTFIQVSLMVAVSLVSALPCCPHDLQMLPLKSTILCQDMSNISNIKWCDSFFVEENFTENSGKTILIFDSDHQTDTYCTGVIANTTFAKEHSLADQIGKDIAMVCFADYDEDETHFTLYAICLLISSFFLLLTTIIYFILPELRDLHGKCVLCFIISLMIGYISLAYLQLPFTQPYIDETKCVLLAFLTYFWMMSAFFWLNINSFNMWRSAVLSKVMVSEKRLMLLYYLSGWGFPMVFLLIAVVTHHIPGNHIQPNFGKRSCWFQGKLELWSFFYGPVLVLLILNIVYFVSTARYLWSDYRSPNATSTTRVKSLRIKFCLYFKLFVVMGMTWIFEILSSIDDEPWYVTDILNCFQGLIIFIVMIALRKRVWRALAAKKYCGFEFTSCWNKLEDEETDREIIDDHKLSSTTAPMSHMS